MRDVKDAEVRRAEIMDVTMKLFQQKGYLKTRTQDIIEAAGISRGLLYYHFKDKEDILFCLIERKAAPLLKRLEIITYQTDLLPQEKVKQFIEATILSDEQITSEDLTLQTTIDLDINRYVLDRFYHKLCQQMIIYFAHILQEGKEKGIFNIDNVQQTAIFLMTGYVFSSNDINLTIANKQEALAYLISFQTLLERILESSEPIFET